METIRIKDVSFRYPSSEEPVLKHISLTIHQSEFLVLCGRSGCGKSTLLRQLKKNMIPYGQFEGEILYQGEDLSSCDDRKSASEIGFVQQNPDNQIVTDKVWHELAFGLESLGLDQGTVRRRVAEMASFFGIQTWFRRNTSDLSGGQKQLLNLASVMVMDPKVLILDEPTAQLDPIAASDFFHTLRKINEELGTTILLSEHRLEEVFPMADRAVVMDKGQILCCDEPRNVGAFLAETGNAMFDGMPSAMKIYAYSGGKDTFPMTVREGRNWLTHCLAGKELPKKCQMESSKHRRQVLAKHAKLSVKDVWFRYEKKSADILRGISFDVQEGELFCILGGNGVGKSTVMKAMTGLVWPYKGRIRVDGVEVKKGTVKELFDKRLAMLPQNPQALFTEITVEEEMYEAFVYSKYSEEEQRERVEQMLQQLDMTNLKKLHPYDLSGGEQQRLALGKLLLLEPSILLLDEPTKGLDPFLKKELAKILKALCSQGVTIVMVSHDIEFCAEYADRCGLLFDGEMLSVGTVSEFFAGNHYYTTTANRIGREYFREAVTCQEVSECVRTMM